LIFSKVAKNILGISESIENAGKILSEIVFDSNFNNIFFPMTVKKFHMI